MTASINAESNNMTGINREKARFDLLMKLARIKEILKTAKIILWVALPLIAFLHIILHFPQVFPAKEPLRYVHAFANSGGISFVFISVALSSFFFGIIGTLIAISITGAFIGVGLNELAASLAGPAVAFLYIWVTEYYLEKYLLCPAYEIEDALEHNELILGPNAQEPTQVDVKMAVPESDMPES